MTPRSAQHEPSGFGFVPPRLTTTGPLFTLAGTQTSILSSCQRYTMAGTPPISTPFSPLLKSTNAYGVEPLSEKNPKCEPLIRNRVPIGPAVGVSPLAWGE